MKANQRKKRQKDIFEMLPDAISKFKKNVIEPFFSLGSNGVDESLPLRAEIFTGEQLDQHAKALAKRHTLITEQPSEQLLKRLAENESILLEVHSILTENVKQENRITPAGEWLLDNFYLIEEQIYTAKKHLPKGYSKGLPQLAKGVSAGLPRVYDIAVEIISHSDGHVSLKSLQNFVTAYQLVNFLNLGELWAIPIMLRLALLENLRRLSIQISIDITNKSLATSWADEMIEVAEKNPKNLVLVIADMARSKPPMASSFVAELTRRLQEKGSSLVLAMSWLEQTLSENGLTSSELVQQENQKQAADQVSISNSISSLRFLSTTDWREFVESTSIMEETLKQDAAGIYPSMDFDTKDYYRHIVENISKESDYSEQQVSEMIVQLSKESAQKNAGPRLSHVGYYLRGKQLKKLERLTGAKLTLKEKSKKWVNQLPLTVYIGGITLISFLICWALIGKAHIEGFTNWQLILIAALSLLATSMVAVSIVNWLVTITARPGLLPRMDFSKGIPDDCRTMVVVPTILGSAADVANLTEGLEVRFLANRDANLSFALLTDFKDAKEEHLEEDEIILRKAEEKIIALNKKYERETNDTFFLFHRPRKWNAREKVWMGFERKRGKLGELNALIKGEGKDFFSLIVGNKEIYSTIKYIITLDTDTQLPRDVAWKMTATMAHPLNHPVYSEKKKRVVEGYTILQPRVSNSLPIDESSYYSRMHGNEPGTDPYTRATSDVYQDLFEEGSFIGKGIYDIDAFEKVLKNRFPDNRILSHDLLEGSYARAGLITDLQFYEEYPSSYITDMRRRHRWIRGDWQIAAWTLPFVPTFKNRLQLNPLSFLSKWKIFDNLRRSLVPVALVLLLLFGWIISTNPFFWTMAVLAIVFLPAVVNFIWQLYKKPDDEIFIQHLIYTIRSLKDNFIQQVVGFIFLPFELFVNSGAILRTIWRINISRKKLLEWNPYKNSWADQKTIGVAYRLMWFSPFFAAALFVYLIIYSPLTLAKIFPFLAAWAAAPFIAWFISKPTNENITEISNEQTVYLRKLSRKIWSFFETYVVKEDNWLPPDNYQEEPVERIAHRTSPTNIGLSLLANLTAYDFGYITAGEVIELTSNTINTVQRMEKYRGHLYNWYDTQTLAPLPPRYISTVDSGNLMGHLITLKQGLLTLTDEKLVRENITDGFLDELRILNEKLKTPELKKFIEQLKEGHPDDFDNPEAIKKYLEILEQSVTKILVQLDIDPENEADWWIQKIFTHIRHIKNDMRSFMPWLYLNRPVPEKFKDKIPSLPGMPTIRQLCSIEESLLHSINELYSVENSNEETEWLSRYRSDIVEAGRKAKGFMLTIEQLSAKCTQLINMDYDFLYDKAQHLLTIGYNAEEHRRDNSFYDLMASEIRLTVFVAIAEGKLPQQSWFALGRQLTNFGTTAILLSWSGSMFEYLMPLLVMPGYKNTLLDQTTKAVIQRQIEYGKKRGIPWGISESGYNMVDAHLNYQYHPFGVPGLGFKRGLGEDLVISPYSTVMALMISPKDAYDNLQVLKGEGFEGRFGFYEAIDYTPSRLARKQSFAIVKSFMAHHQGMSLLSINYLLNKQAMQQRFTADIGVKSALLLLQERIPRVTTFYSPRVHETDTSIAPSSGGFMRILDTPHTTMPEVQLLSNGRYHVMVTNAGGGYSRWKNIALNRWREDSTCDNWGTFCYIRDIDNNKSWSSSFQPTLKESDNYEAVFSQGRAEFRRRDMSLETHTEIVVSPEDDIELRRVHITNRSRKKRTIAVTSYAEVVLTTPIADEMHPAFSNLFIQTELNEQRNAIVCTRRPRSENENNPWMFHLMKVHDAEIKNVSYETDRAKFIGRGNTINNPAAVNQASSLSGSMGSVLDPIVSIQYQIILEPYESATIDMIFGIADTKETCNFLIEKYQDRHLINRVLELAWTHSQVILRQINAVESDAQLYSRLAGSIIFSNAALRTDASTILKNHRGQSGLWGYSISGDLPIVLLQIEDSSNIELVKQLVQAHAYWRLKGLLVDLVIWNEDHGGYRQVLHNQIQGLVAPGITLDSKDQLGGIFVRSSDQISNEDRILFLTVAHVVIADKLGTLEEQINGRTKIKTAIPYFNPTKFTASLDTSVTPPTDLIFYNGYGGFSKDGKEYVITTNKNKFTPAPWSNVMANPQFGTVITESGQSYTWIENAHEFRLTPWNNDPVTDLKGEAFYLRDEESGRFWSPMPLPVTGKSPYITRHGFGYSIFEHSEDGIETEACIYVDIESPVKFIVIKVHNTSGRQRRISVTGYIEWVLGDLRAKSVKQIITEIDTRSGALLARNPYNTEFENRVAFFDVDDPNKFYTTDRSEFIGRNGTLHNPDAMSRSKLSGKTGAALDPCAAIQVLFDLVEDEEHEVIFRLGAGKNSNEVLETIRRFEGSNAAQKALQKINAFWKETLEAVQIETPDTATNVLANGWLNYQALACRMWARSGFYQSGGAFGFRDQLQDVLSLIHTKPAIVKQQIILCASRQFKEGDVQHWWHPPAGRGVRTTCSDDYLWLPYVASRYISTTGDAAILEETAYFLEGRLLNAGEESYYDLPVQSDQQATLYEHCVKAIEHGFRFGVNGLPLMGSGDWNDGMDKVGEHGRGESIWLAFFLYDILIRFIEVATIKNDNVFASTCKQQAAQLKKNIHLHAWDGEWYRRAYFDDGTPLGSKENDECRIDSIAQSWSVLSKAGDKDRSVMAMQSASKHLVRKEDHIIQLFNPPFDKSAMNPGYIKGYVPGVRENGGQYTHAAIWLVMAFAQQGNAKKTWELLQMINPVNHSTDTSSIEQYKTEPYVIAADVYGVKEHKGRGGWSWYTGSSGWMYQLILESFIGLKRKGNSLSFAPCFPEEWSSVKINYTYSNTVYKVELIQNALAGIDTKIILDGNEEISSVILLVDDGGVHDVKVYLPSKEVILVSSAVSG
jgi:cyclic beta-1,2-glucan synthetase